MFLELLKVLDDDDQPITKRIKIANNAFMSSQVPLQHKEVVLILWLLKKFDGTNKHVFKLIKEWLKSTPFNELNRNDVDNREIKDIMEVFTFFTISNIKIISVLAFQFY